jgi:hypothetical protein
MRHAAEGRNRHVRTHAWKFGYDWKWVRTLGNSEGPNSGIRKKTEGPEAVSEFNFAPQTIPEHPSGVGCCAIFGRALSRRGVELEVRDGGVRVSDSDFFRISEVEFLAFQPAAPLFPTAGKCSSVPEHHNLGFRDPADLVGRISDLPPLLFSIEHRQLGSVPDSERGG